MDANRVPQPRHDDDTVEAHYACLERMCACLEAGCSSATKSRRVRRGSLLPLPPLRG